MARVRTGSHWLSNLSGTENGTKSRVWTKISYSVFKKKATQLAGHHSSGPSTLASCELSHGYKIDKKGTFTVLIHCPINALNNLLSITNNYQVPVPQISIMNSTFNERNSTKTKTFILELFFQLHSVIDINA